MWALPEATSSKESNGLTRSPPAKYCTCNRPSVMSVSAWAMRCAPVPRPGKSRGQVLTMTTSRLPWAMAGAATVAAATPVAPAAAFFRKPRRFMPGFMPGLSCCLVFCFIFLSFGRCDGKRRVHRPGQARRHVDPPSWNPCRDPARDTKGPDPGSRHSSTNLAARSTGRPAGQGDFTL